MGMDMEKHEKFTEWAVAGGVKLYAVAVHRFPGRGLGIIATETHEVCVHILSLRSHVLFCFMRSEKSVK